MTHQDRLNVQADPATRQLPADQDLIRKRRYVGLVALACLGSSLLATITGQFDPFWIGGLLRAGLVLAALWLALPTTTRPAAWARISGWKVAALVAFGVLIPRLKFLLPVLIVGMLLGWLIRPRHRR
jgi:hypothetical protein